MANAGAQQLDKRLARIEARRRALSRGAIYSVNHDGLIIARPRRRGFRRPVHLVFVAAFGIVAFKALLFAGLGASTYEARVENLSQGTVIEQAGAWVMHADALTQWLAVQGKMLFS